jgi:LacI family transcriptional regulator
VALVAFDDSPWTTLTSPQLSVVAQPAYEIGACCGGAAVDGRRSFGAHHRAIAAADRAGEFDATAVRPFYVV